MARLQNICCEKFDAFLSADHSLNWQQDRLKKTEKLPQIFFENGSPWDEVNVWAAQRVFGKTVDSQTVHRNMKHLCNYAKFLEENNLDWRHFPVEKIKGSLRIFRKSLIDGVKAGKIANKTASNCMNACVQFHRFAYDNGMLVTVNNLFNGQLHNVFYYDTTGFERAFTVNLTDWSIRNNERIGFTLEDGLLPLQFEHMTQLLQYTSAHESEELHLMLSAGFFTGSRIGSITTFKVSSLELVRKDPQIEGLYRLAVGPGTGIRTKFDVSAEILIPEAVLLELRRYAYSTRRLKREAKAVGDVKGLLFLTMGGGPYSVATVDKLVNEMRKKAKNAGLVFMEFFMFHESRATFGTWLMSLLLEVVDVSSAVATVKEAMAHKDEATTLRYVKFKDVTKGKMHFAAKFNEAFAGIQGRDWDKNSA